MEFFVDKTILVTGATGFLAKVVVEKILRTQPDVKKIFLLIRAKDSSSAKQRFIHQVVESELFSVVREKYGGDLFAAILEEKVFPVAGDVSFEDLGIENREVKDEMLREVDIIINSAATTTFNERYDVAMSINTLGAVNVLNFAKNCFKVNIALVHVSTAYVCGEGNGIILEKPLILGETLNGTSKLDIDVEKKVIQEKLMELQTHNATENDVKSAMKDLGIQRAKVHGWPNTYSFTKAMGEMLLFGLKENVCVIILRPTVITSTYKEPFPGWIEGARTIDIFVLMYGKGKSNFMLGDPNTILDAIPVDMVVNSMLASIIVHHHHHHHHHHGHREDWSSSCSPIYHVGSSSCNDNNGKPLRLFDVMNMLFRYFTETPWTSKSGDLVRVRQYVLLPSMTSLRRYIALRYLPLLQVLKVMNMILYHYFEEKCRSVEKSINMVTRFAEIYKPYVFFYATFDDTNTRGVRMEIRERSGGDDTLFFDPNCIDWEDYFINTHFPGVVKYAF